MSAESVLAPDLVRFVALVGVLTVIPGADMALVTANTVRGNRSGGLATTLGIVFGVFLWGAAAGLGLAAVVATSAVWFNVIKFAGSAYLLYLGVRLLLRACSNARAQADDIDDGVAPSIWRYFRDGLAVDILNPKMGIFYVAILSQFLHPGDPVFAKAMLLASIHAAIGLLWFTFYTVMINRLNAVLRRPRIKRATDGVSGIVLVALGANLALAHNP